MRIDLVTVVVIVLLAVAVTIAVASPRARRFIVITIALVGAALTGKKLLERRTIDYSDDDTPRVPPRRFDDADHRDTDRAADETDLDAGATNRAVGDLDARARARADRIAELERRASDE